MILKLILNVCVDFELEGDISYRKARVHFDPTNENQFFFNSTWSNMTMRVEMNRYSDVNHSCTQTHFEWVDMVASQHLSRPPCASDFDFDLSVNVPWGVSFGITPGCDNQRRAVRTSNWGPAWQKWQLSSEVIMHVDAPGGAIIQGDQVPWPDLCLSLFTKFHPETTNGDDIKSGPRQQVCLDGAWG